MAREIRANGRRRDVFHDRERGHLLLVQAEAAEVVGKIQHAIAREPGNSRLQQAHMIALDVEIAGALGIGEGRRIAEHQVVFPAIGFEPGQGIGLGLSICRRLALSLTDLPRSLVAASTARARPAEQSPRAYPT